MKEKPPTEIEKLSKSLNTMGKLALILFCILLGLTFGAYLTQATFNRQCDNFKRIIAFPYYSKTNFICGKE